MSKVAYQEKYFAEWIKLSGAGEVPVRINANLVLSKDPKDIKRTSLGT